VFRFTITHKAKNCLARTGVIETNHGFIETPAFVAVASSASVKTLSPQEITKSGTQIFFINTFHLHLRPGENVIKKFGGIHKFINWDGPIISDSGGFQIFSLSRDKEKNLVKIYEDHVELRSPWDGSKHFLTPQKSISIQKSLGADIIICLDDCTPYPVQYKTAKISLERTHRWAILSLEAYKKQKSTQALYGVVQGSVFESLRKKSAKFISSLPFCGIAIGGVSVGESKEQMKKVLEWVIPLLPENKPRHLLGVGEIDDIFTLVQKGVDTFDCVMPTRLGRMGHILIKEYKSKKFSYDITKIPYATDKRPLDPSCKCWVCKKFSRGYINHLFRTKELLGYRLATYHNLYFVNSLVKKIREAIKGDRLEKLKGEWLGEE